MRDSTLQEDSLKHSSPRTGPPGARLPGAADAAARLVFILLLGYAAARSLVAAAGKAFWFDEMCTWAVARQPNVAAVWRAVAQALEPNPPPFYVVEHFFGTLARNEQIGYRLPSILAFACMMVCVFVCVRRRASAVPAVACGALPLVTIVFDRYAIDARPYSLELACIAFAVVCYQRAQERRWMILMGASLALATSFHYYAVFALVPFALAEFALWLDSPSPRVPRAGVWLALAAGVVPLAVFWPLLAGFRAHFGAHFWGKPTLRSATDTYGWLFEASLPARATIAVTLLLLAIALIVVVCIRRDFRAAIRRRGHLQEYVLAVGFVALPLVVLAGAKVAGGGMTARYALPVLLGVALGVGHILAPLKQWATALVAVAVLFAVGNHERQFWKSRPAHFATFVSPAAPLEELLKQTGREDLPVVISNGLDYLSIVHYAPPQDAARFVALVDPVASVEEIGNDSLDQGLLAIRCCMDIRVETYGAFVARHPMFLLYSDGDIDFDRWPSRLMRRGQALNILETEGSRSLYMVDSRGASGLGVSP